MSDDVHAMTASEAGSRGTQLVFTILAIVQATLIFTIALIMIPLPRIAAEFALSESQILLLQVASGLPFSGLLLFGGRLADRYGARCMLIVGLTVFGGASLIAPFAPSFGVLIGMRFLEGAGGALTAPAALAVLRTLFPDPTTFRRAMAIWGGVSVLGATLGFVSSGMVASVISWRWMFAVPIAVSALGLAAATYLLPAHPSVPERTHRPALDPIGALLATLGIVLASFGLIASHENRWASAQVLGSLGVGIILLTAFVAWERKMEDPLLPATFLRDLSRAVGLVGTLLAAAGSLLIEYILLTYFQQFRGWTPFDTAASFLPFALVLVVANFVTARVVSRFGPTTATVAGFLIGAAGLARLAGIERETAYLTVFLPGQLLLALGVALAFAGAAVLSTANVPPHKMGLAGGVMNTAMELGPTVGFAILMAVAATRADTVAGYARAFGAAAAAYGFAAVLSLIAARRSSLTL